MIPFAGLVVRALSLSLSLSALDPDRIPLRICNLPHLYLGGYSGDHTHSLAAAAYLHVCAPETFNNNPKKTVESTR